MTVESNKASTGQNTNASSKVSGPHPIFWGSIVALKTSLSRKFFNGKPMLSFVGERLIREAQQRLYPDKKDMWPLQGLKITNIGKDTDGYNSFAFYRNTVTSWWGSPETGDLQNYNAYRLRPVLVELQLQIIDPDQSSFINTLSNINENLEGFSFSMQGTNDMLRVNCRVDIENDFAVSEPDGEGETEYYFKAEIPLKLHTFVGTPVKQTIPLNISVNMPIGIDPGKEYTIDEYDKLLFEGRDQIAQIKFSFDGVNVTNTRGS